MSNEYKKRLRHPKWQRKRLEKMQSADWRCERCGDGNETLHVHHHQYRNGNPWDYSLGELECLCETCHTLTHLPHDKVTQFVAQRQVALVNLWRGVVSEIERTMFRVEYGSEMTFKHDDASLIGSEIEPAVNALRKAIDEAVDCLAKERVQAGNDAIANLKVSAEYHRRRLGRAEQERGRN